MLLLLIHTGRAKQSAVVHIILNGALKIITFKNMLTVIVIATRVGYAIARLGEKRL